MDKISGAIEGKIKAAKDAKASGATPEVPVGTSPLLQLASAQAIERSTTQSNPSTIAAEAGKANALSGGQAELASRVGVSGTDQFYGGVTPAEVAQRQPSMALAANFARGVVDRELDPEVVAITACGWPKLLRLSS